MLRSFKEIICQCEYFEGQKCELGDKFMDFI